MNYKIVGKYIKDLRFEIPNPNTFFLLEKNISNYKVNIDIKSHKFKDAIVEIVITLSLNPVKDDTDKINTRISFSIIAKIDGNFLDKKLLEEIILIEIPNKIYPEIRSLFILLFEKSGFNKIKIEEKIDFKALYLKRDLQ